MEGSDPFGWKHPRVLFLEEEKRRELSMPYLFYFFTFLFFFYSYNSFSTYVLVCFLGV